MKDILLILLCAGIGFIFSETLLYIFNQICYFVVGVFVKFGGNKIQQRIAKFLSE